MSQYPPQSPYVGFDVPESDPRRPPVLAAVILAASVLVVLAILFGAAASSPPPPLIPVDTGPGPTTQLGIARTPNDPANP